MWSDELSGMLEKDLPAVPSFSLDMPEPGQQEDPFSLDEKNLKDVTDFEKWLHSADRHMLDGVEVDDDYPTLPADNEKPNMPKQEYPLPDTVDEEVPSVASHITQSNVPPVVGNGNLVGPLSLPAVTSTSLMYLNNITPQQLEKNKRNAFIAKQNREKKKKQFKDYENENAMLKARLAEQQQQLQEKDSQHQKDMRKIEMLEDEVGYYRDVLENQSDLASFLGQFTNNTGQKPHVELVNRKRCAIESDHDYEARRYSTRAKRGKTTGGICMHLSKGGGGAKVTLDTCRKCAENAKK